MGVGYAIGFTSKAVNSTSRTFTTSISGSAFIKEPCDFRNPVIQVEGNPGTYNYMTLGDAYYWVDSVVSVTNAIIEVHGHLDPLATYQDEIANCKAYALYHSKIINTEADDIRFNPEVVAPKTVINASNIFASSPTPLSGGSVILTTFEAGISAANQGIKTYAMSLSTFRSIIQNITTSLYDHQFDIGNNNTAINNNLSNFTGPDDIANMLGALGSVAIHDVLYLLCEVMNKIGGFGSWRENLIKAIYVPFTGFTVVGTKNVHFGYLNTGVSASLIDPVQVKTNSTSIQLPYDGLTQTHHFLKYSRFHQFQAVCCGGQYASIDSNLLRDLDVGDTLNIYTSVEICSGDWSAVLTKDSSVNSLRLAAFGGNMAIDITGLAGSGGMGAGMNYTIGGVGIAGNIVAGALGGGLGGQISGVASQYLPSQGSQAPSATAGNGISSIFLNGSTGYNDLSIIGQLTYPAIFDNIAGSDYDSYCQQYGYPCFQYVPLSLDGSYVVCSGAFVACKGNQQDQSYINSVCNSGILLES